MTTEEYCREIEAYLCRKNDGHLVRIVGPSFERVCRWSEQGVPFRIACAGIDRYFIRYYAKGPRRRPVQIDFCEDDVLDAFEEWRRAVGVRAPGSAVPEEEAAAKQRKKSLPEHLDRVSEKITNRRAGLNPLPDDYDRVLDEITSEIAAFRELPSPIRGETRDKVSAHLADLDARMIDAARAHAGAALETLRAEAAEQLRPFRDRMPADAYQQALEAAIDNLVREQQKLPVVAFM